MISIEKLTKIALKRQNLEILQIFSYFGSFWGPWGQLKKSPEISTNTYRTKLNLCELNSMCKTLKVEYKFGA